MSQKEIHIHIEHRTEDDRPKPEDQDKNKDQDKVTPFVRVTRTQTSRRYSPYVEKHLKLGMTISEIRQEVWDEFNLAEGLVTLCNGEPAPDYYVPEDGDWVHFSAAPKELGA